MPQAEKATIEAIKTASNDLRGDIAAELVDGACMNALDRDLAPASSVVAEFHPVLHRLMADRREGESLGNFCHCYGVDRQRTEVGSSELSA